MPFIGVRISWLIVARNSDFALFASPAAFAATSASSFAIFNENSNCFRSVISSTIAANAGGVSLRISWRFIATS